jgi:hypothetical protein
MNEMNGIRPLPLGVSRRSPIKGTEGGVMQRSYSSTFPRFRLRNSVIDADFLRGRHAINPYSFGYLGDGYLGT